MVKETKLYGKLKYEEDFLLSTGISCNFCDLWSQKSHIISSTVLVKL